MELTYRHLLRESVPLAGLLFVWYVLGALVAPLAEWIIPNPFPVGFRTVALATATVFVVVRGITIARETDVLVLSGDFRELLRESVVVAVPVLVWAGLATVVALVETVLFGFLSLSMELATTFDAVFPTVMAVTTQTALATAGLYVVVRIAQVLRLELGSGRTAASTDD